VESSLLSKDGSSSKLKPTLKYAAFEASACLVLHWMLYCDRAGYKAASVKKEV
jgi:hypothetical protein